MPNYSEPSPGETQQLYLLGRQPNLGLAELESLLGTGQLESFGQYAALSTELVDARFFKRLGGSIKLANVLTILNTSDWPSIEKFAKTQLAGLLNLPSEGKIQLGVSLYGVKTTTAEVQALGLTIKKQLKRSARLVPVQGQTYLSTAQVLYNKLTGERGCEIVFYTANGCTAVAVTRAEQDINAYAKRDQGRPKRDTKIGMLPPKLAQIIVNLASSNSTPAGSHLLDPFCGTGVLLQEALLMGYDVYGTDLEPRMIDYSRANLDWLPLPHSGKITLEVGDAITHRWQPPTNVVASETYLGRPFAVMPSAEQLAETISATNVIIKKFLRNIHSQLEAGSRLCLAVPAWQIQKDTFKRLPLLDLLEEMGYNQVSFEHVEASQLTYYRSDQIVARQLIVLTTR